MKGYHHPLAALPSRPATARDVANFLVWQRWDPSVAFYEGSRSCRRLAAALIRGAVPLLRKRLRHRHQEVHALVEAIDVAAADRELERRWQEAIDRLRALYHASPTGTARERSFLLDVARDRKLVGAMRVAAEARGEPADPTWLAVFAAEGSRGSVALVERARREEGARYPDLFRELERFRGALDEPMPRACGVRAAAPPAGGRMTVEEFWAVVDAASEAGDPAEALREALEALSLRQVAAFDRHLRAMMRKAYRWDVWGAAYLMLGGCSDDAFQDFRASLVARGRAAFERVIADPDELADLADLDGDETFAAVAREVYEALGAEPLPAPAARRRPAGRSWNFDDAAQQRRRYPRLWKRFGKGRA
ncbi:MAG TPA: DUF4240 domain-containing protein [Myxococcales bacterium]